MVEGDQVKTCLSAFCPLQMLCGLKPNLPARQDMSDEWNLFNYTYRSVSSFLLEYEVQVHYSILLQLRYLPWQLQNKHTLWQNEKFLDVKAGSTIR
jgi:hypothetical protein